MKNDGKIKPPLDIKMPHSELDDGAVRLESYPKGRINIQHYGEWKTLTGNYW